MPHSVYISALQEQNGEENHTGISGYLTPDITILRYYYDIKRLESEPLIEQNFYIVIVFQVF